MVTVAFVIFDNSSVHHNINCHFFVRHTACMFNVFVAVSVICSVELNSPCRLLLRDVSG